MKNGLNILLLGLVCVSLFSCGETSSSSENLDSGLRINGISLSKYSIVYPKDGKGHEKKLAERMRTAIKRELDVSLPVKADDSEETRYELRIGLTNRMGELELKDNEYCIGNDEDSLYFYAPTSNGMVNAIENMMIPLVYDKTIENYIVDNQIVENIEDRSLSIMSYNVRVALDTTDDKPRPQRVLSMINKVSPDVFGVQEASTTWMSHLNNGLSSTYSYVGLGRDGGSNGEHTAIFYKTSKYNYIEGGTKWLSDTPDKVSKLPDCQYNRIVTYALFERISDGLKFAYMNTHLDHLSGNLYDKLRVNQSKVIFDIAKNYEDYPIFVTGDFNDYTGAVRDAFIEEGFEYSKYDALISDDSHTYPTSLYANSVNQEKIIIDYCFSKGDNYLIDKYDVLTEDIGGGPTSDHFPILTNYVLHKPFSKGPKIEQLFINDDVKLIEGNDAPSNLIVRAIFDDGEETILPNSKYLVEGINEKIHYGKTYNIVVKSVDNPSVSVSKELSCNEIYKDTSSFTLTGDNVRVTTEKEYKCNEFDNNHEEIGTTTIVKGMDNCATKSTGGTISFSVYTAKEGMYKFNYECASLYLLKASDGGYYTKDTNLGDVVDIYVNGEKIDISSVIVKGHAKTSSSSSAMGALARCFQVLDLGSIKLNVGENNISIKGRTDCTLRNTYNEIPVPNTKSCSLDFVK